MWERRIAYLAAMFGCLVFYGFYREWFSWFLLVIMATLPWFSLLISLPAMLTVKADLRCPSKVRQDMPVRTALLLSGPFPAPPISCSIRLVNSLTGQRFIGEPGEQIPTNHCGLITISYPQMFVYDYLGLFRRRLHRSESCTVYVEPKPIPDSQPPQPEGTAVRGWRPKPGGGFSEIHDLRLYRPGDDLRHIHWKMAAKTGKLIYREPMEPVQKGYVLNITLSGTPDETDRILGQLLWTGHVLLEKNLSHTVHAMTGKGLLTYTVHDSASLETCLHGLLSSSKAEVNSIHNAENVLWQRHIGGDRHEA